GLNRDVFPRVVREDPLLGDSARRALESCLPDVPIKARGRAEDRYLFAQLCAAAPRVTLSWSQCDDDGKRKVLSPLVERMLAGRAEEDVPAVAALHHEPPDSCWPRTALASAIRAGLAGEREDRAELLALCLADSVPAEELPAVARARARVLAAYERGPHEPRVLSPWLGFVGRRAEVGVRPDLAQEPPSVTLVEALPKCPA